MIVVVVGVTVSPLGGTKVSVPEVDFEKILISLPFTKGGKLMVVAVVFVITKQFADSVSVTVVELDTTGGLIVDFDIVKFPEIV